jgi:hypothetical protein
MKENQQLRDGIADTARIAILRSDDPEVRRHIAALLNSLDDTLSYEQVLEELKALRAGRPPSAELLLITRQFVNKETRHRQGIAGSSRGMKKRACSPTRSPDFNSPTPFPTFLMTPRNLLTWQRR